MANNSTVLIAATTSAATSEKLSPILNNTTSVVFGGLQGSETVSIEVQDPSLGTWYPTTKVYTSTSDPWVDGFYTALPFRFVKSITSAPVQVTMVQNVNTNTIRLGGY